VGRKSRVQGHNNITNQQTAPAREEGSSYLLHLNSTRLNSSQRKNAATTATTASLLLLLHPQPTPPTFTSGRYERGCNKCTSTTTDAPGCTKLLRNSTRLHSTHISGTDQSTTAQQTFLPFLPSFRKQAKLAAKLQQLPVHRQTHKHTSS